MSNRGRPRKRTRELRNQSGKPQLSLTWQLDEAGFEAGDAVETTVGDGYVLIHDAEQNPREVLSVEQRDNIPSSPVQSKFEATVVGNRLWMMGERFEDMGEEHIAQETKHMARRFHAVANGSEIKESIQQ